MTAAMPEALAKAVHELTVAVEDLSGRLRRRTYLMGAMIGVVVVVGAIVVLVIWLQNRRMQESIESNNRKWCATLTILTMPGPGPTTPRGRAITAQLGELARDFGCDSAGTSGR